MNDVRSASIGATMTVIRRHLIAVMTGEREQPDGIIEAQVRPLGAPLGGMTSLIVDLAPRLPGRTSQGATERGETTR